jgi:hypothetical protein
MINLTPSIAEKVVAEMEKFGYVEDAEDYIAVVETEQEYLIVTSGYADDFSDCGFNKRAGDFRAQIIGQYTTVLEAVHSLHNLQKEIMLKQLKMVDF